jgi:hypothetical protein
MVSKATLHLTVTGTGIVAEHRNGRGVLWAASAEYRDPAELAEAVAALIAVEGAPTDRRVWVEVAPPLLQCRRIDALPPVRARQLAELVAAQPGRYFRKNGKPLVTAATWLPGGRKTALLVAIEEPYAGALLIGAERAGLEIVDICPVVDAAPLRLSLLPAGETAARRGRIDRWIRNGAIAAAALWVVLGAMTYARSTSQLEALQEELGTLRAPVAAILAARAEMDEAAAGIAAVETPMTVRLGPALTLTTVVSALPDSAWFTAIAIDRRGTGRVEGAAPRPAVLLARLERTGVLGRVRSEGRTVSDVLAGRAVERFSFRFGQEGDR